MLKDIKKKYLLNFLKENTDKKILRYKKVLIDNVPYRLQTLLMPEMKNRAVLEGWLQYHMIRYLQKRNPNVGLDKVFSKNEFVTIGLVLSVLMAIIVWVILEMTKFGYELKATGLNKNAAKYCGMKEKKNIILTMMISGGLAGMGAAVFYLTGMEQWMVQQTSIPAMGFNGIAAAFLGGAHPVGAIFSSYFIQHITSGGTYVDKSMYCSQISDLISALIIYLCGFVLFFKMWLNKFLDKREEKRNAIAQKGGAK